MRNELAVSHHLPQPHAVPAAAAGKVHGPRVVTGARVRLHAKGEPLAAREALRCSTPRRIPWTSHHLRRARAQGRAFCRGGASCASRSPRPHFPVTAAAPSNSRGAPTATSGAAPDVFRRNRPPDGRTAPAVRAPAGVSRVALARGRIRGAPGQVTRPVQNVEGVRELAGIHAPDNRVNDSLILVGLCSGPSRTVFFMAVKRPPETLPYASFGGQPIELRGRPRQLIPPLLC